MGLFRRSPSPAVPVQQQQQQQYAPNDQSSRTGQDSSRLGVDVRQYHSNPNSAMPSPNLSLEHTRSRSPLPSPNIASSSSPSTNNNGTSPWTGYLQEGQYTNASSDDTKKDSRSKSSNKKDKKKANNETNAQQEHEYKPPVVELRKLDLGAGDGSSRASTLNLARFSVNGMLSLVEQRMSLEERQQQAQSQQMRVQRNNGLGLSVGIVPGSSSSTSPYSSRNEQKMSSVSSSKRTMHALGEAMEPEEVLSANAPSTCSHVQRPRTSSSASDAAVLRNEVVDLLLLARKASATPTFSCTSAMAASTSSGSSFSSSSISPTSQEAHADIAKCSSSASARDPALSYGVKVNEHGRYVGKGTASKDQLEELARAVSPPPPHTTTVVQGKTKKKFGLFGGNNSAGKEGDNAASASPVLSQSPDMKPASTVRVPMRAQSPLPPRGASTAGGSSSRAQYAMQMTSFKAGPPVSGTHRNPMAAQHRRKRSMSVGDASAFFPTTSSSSKVQTQAHANARCRVRPDVYDESYFSNLKTPFYCTASLGESQQHSKRANQLARLGIVEDAEVGPVGDDEESLSVAKERLLAQARTAVGHPSPTSQAQAPARAQYKDSSKEQYAVYAHNVRMDNPPSAAASFASASSAATAASQSTLSSGESQKSQKRQGQLVLQGETSGSFHLTAANRPPAQVTWTSPAQSQQQQQPEPRSARSNSDASILDPFLPGGGNASKNSNSKRPTHLVVPSLSPGLTAHIPDSVAAIGPPPASPLPSPPSAPSGRASPSVKELRAPSPSQQMILPPARSPAPTSPLPPLPAAVCPAPVQRALQASSPSPPQPTRSPPAVPLSENGEKTEYDFELRPHRTKQQGRPRLSPLHERERTSPPESPALDKMMAVPPRPFGTRGIVQRPPSALNMNLLPSPAPPPPMTSTTATMMTSSSPSSSNSLSSGSAPTPKARDFDHAQLRRRQETATTFASQYSTEGEFEGYDASRSSGSSGISSSSTNATGNFKQPSGSNGHSGSSAGHTTLSSTPSYSSSSSMTSYNSSASRPSLTMSMDGSSTEDDHSSVSTHHSNNGRRGQEGYGYVHVNMAVPMKPPRKGMTASPSCESVNNLAGIGLAKGQYQYPHSRRMHFGWSRHKAMLDLAGHIGEEAASPYDFNEGNGKEEVSSPGSEDDAYAGILGAYDTQRAKTGPSHSHDDEGYIGSSPEMVSSQAELSKSDGAPARQKIAHQRVSNNHGRAL